MIDTLKFKVPVAPDIYQHLEDWAESKTFKGTVVKRWHLPVKLPSYDKNINLLGYDESGYLFVEFNPIKLIKGNNVEPCSLDEIENVVEEVCHFLSSEFGLIDSTGGWMVTRLDDAYMWDYGSLEQAKLVISVLKHYSKNNFDTTAYKGNSKFYLKYPELLAHGDALLISEKYSGYLRFEYRLDDVALENNFGSNYWHVIINSNPKRFKEIAENRLLRWFEGEDLNSMTKDEVQYLLIKEYGDYGLKLYGYLELRDGDSLLKGDILSKMGKTKRYRYNRDLKKVGVGSPSGIEFPSFQTPRYLVNYENYRSVVDAPASTRFTIPLSTRKGDIFAGDFGKTGL